MQSPLWLLLKSAAPTVELIDEHFANTQWTLEACRKGARPRLWTPHQKFSQEGPSGFKE